MKKRISNFNLFMIAYCIIFLFVICCAFALRGNKNHQENEQQITIETNQEEDSNPVVVPEVEIVIPEEKTVRKETVKAVETSTSSELISLGKCKITAYCRENYPHICNNGDSSKTATGTTPTAGRTCAVDPKLIPYGSKIIINGHTYIAEDCGGAIKGKRIDICFNTHQEALNFGIRYADVYILSD